MSEPTLESIDDYSTLSGVKKKVVVAIIISGLIMGAIYTIASSVFGHVEPTSIDKTYNKVPMK